MNRFLGFLVVRCPKFNFDKEGRGAFLNRPPELHGRYYGGVDRMQWFDVDEGFYNKSLPKELLGIRESINNEASQSDDLKYSRSIDDARKLMRFSNKKNAHNELVAIFEGNDEPQGCRDETAKVSIDDFIGIDLYCDGYGSLIREGVFVKPGSFSAFTGLINELGLLPPEDEVVRSYLECYSTVSDSGEIEIMPQRIRRLLLFKVP